jgi:hypothetical protein
LKYVGIGGAATTVHLCKRVWLVACNSCGSSGSVFRNKENYQIHGPMAALRCRNEARGRVHQMVSEISEMLKTQCDETARWFRGWLLALVLPSSDVVIQGKCRHTTVGIPGIILSWTISKHGISRNWNKFNPKCHARRESPRLVSGDLTLAGPIGTRGAFEFQWMEHL